MYYVAVDIGCIECGESSNVIGIFTDKEKAEQALDTHEKYQAKHWHGQHSFEIFEVSEIDKALEVVR
jgi:hypothetical protein